MKILRKLFILSLLFFLTSNIYPATVVRGRVTVKGSDTMVILVQLLAEEYMTRYRGKIIQVTGGGTGIGVAGLINKVTDIANASRPLTSEERERIKKAWGKEPKEVKIALDGITIYVHPENPIKEISLEQLKSIYTGKVKSWKDFGWEDRPIIVYTRENNSGTYVFFKEHVLDNEDYTNRAQSLPGTGAVVDAVSKERYSIGYGGVAYSKGVKILPVKTDNKSKAYLPTEANIRKGLYPISRALYMYTCNYDDPDVKSFIDWILTPDGQKIVSKVGYFPLK
ncbi:MAG TPA: phosphate ABC transporter substrate-binding protein [bacterium]|jgi:phosphate transport system substrate-binding protein|nr:phosphate ABC transporter substrate-binding protein [bacterium]HON73142.1 phosphate ABC transporter substrate-binding protein [bacterium]